MNKKTNNSKLSSNYSSKIDIVITWVDGNDINWVEDMRLHSGVNLDKYANGPQRYRDWNTLKYLLRGIDRYCPWVRRVHLVTSGHLPDWINLDSTKLNIVKHEDYIPAEFLPTFSSHPIELNFHRIKGLAEKFVYFNDDTLILKSLGHDYFFHNGLPRDEARLQPVVPDGSDSLFPHIPLNVTAAVNRNFHKNKVILSNINGWLNPKYGLMTIVRTILLLPYSKFVGFTWFHLPTPLLKSTLEEVWKKEHELLTQSSSHKFRDTRDVNQYIFKAWQYASGKFTPTRLDKKGIPLFDISRDPESVYKAIQAKKYKIICVNDGIETHNFEESREQLIKCLEVAFPAKSVFEI